MNKITLTADGSNTLYNENIGEHYHSKHGAVQESKHVFIGAGLQYVIEGLQNEAGQPGAKDIELSVLEVGFGTGLNFLLTASYCYFLEQPVALNYTAIEAFPLHSEELESTGYDNYVPAAIWNGMLHNYGKAFQQAVSILPGQQWKIVHTYLHRYETGQRFDLLYYDAFSVQHQPEMWTDEIIAHACSFLKPGGVFVTYAITGKLKRALKTIGFTIEKLPGAPGKREMLRATKQA
jgi:tRNA U34 5-methylaminomethyl-2-thiouridine-forming methyltransferase MnmC